MAGGIGPKLSCVHSDGEERDSEADLEFLEDEQGSQGDGGERSEEVSKVMINFHGPGNLGFSLRVSRQGILLSEGDVVMLERGYTLGVKGASVRLGRSCM